MQCGRGEGPSVDDVVSDQSEMRVPRWLTVFTGADKNMLRAGAGVQLGVQLLLGKEDKRLEAGLTKVL